MNNARKQVELPYAFEYDGKTYRGFEGVLDGALKVSVEKREFADYPGAGWYTVWFENVGDRPTAALRNIRQIDRVFAGAKPLLRGILGDHGQKYRPYEHDFTEGGKEFVSLEGRATHNVFPYFDLVHGGGGTLVALGWAGTWKATFSPAPGGVRLAAENCVGFDAQLLPGEKMRTALVVRIPYKGRNADKAANLWRRWYLKYILPRNADGSDLKPLSTAGFAQDTGLPNSDGSISERHFTWRPTLEKLIAEKVVPDFRWFDAGWYSDPSGKTVESDWWGTIGSWELDKEKWPGATFRESNEACHKAGMKVFVWFEPERVTNVPDLVKNCDIRECERAVTSGVSGGDARVKDILFEDCRFEALLPSQIHGDENCRPENFVFDSCVYRQIECLKVRHSREVWGRQHRKRSRAFLETNAFCSGVKAVNCAPGEPGASGILVLSFDDRNFDGWEKAMPLFAKHGAHATFFVSGDINNAAVRTMKKLSAAGHSVGLHGQTHANADVAIAAMGAEKYWDEEIRPQADRMYWAYLPVTSFAYPNCRRTNESDELFYSKGYDRVRGGVKGATPYEPEGEKQADRKPLAANEAVFVPASELPKRRRLDTITVGEAYRTDIGEILACIRRAAERREVLVVTSHDIAPDAKGIHMKTEWLEKMLALARELNLPVLGFDELPQPE